MDLLKEGDSVEARRRLTEMDSTLAPLRRVATFLMVRSFHLESATYHLALGDTAGAEARLAEIEQPFGEYPFEFSIGLGYGGDPQPWLGCAGYFPEIWQWLDTGRRKQRECIAGSWACGAAVIPTCSPW